MTIIMTQVAIDTLDLSVSVASQPFGATNQPAIAGSRQTDRVLSASNTELLI